MTRPLMTDADRTDVFRGLAHPLRRRILRQIGRDEASIGDLLAKLSVSPQTLSQHLAVLRETGLVEYRRAGRQRLYRVCPRPLQGAQKWLGQIV